VTNFQWNSCSESGQQPAYIKEYSLNRIKCCATKPSSETIMTFWPTDVRMIQHRKPTSCWNTREFKMQLPTANRTAAHWLRKTALGRRNNNPKQHNSSEGVLLIFSTTVPYVPCTNNDVSTCRSKRFISETTASVKFKFGTTGIH
jgi:hypothetical protein